MPIFLQTEPVASIYAFVGSIFTVVDALLFAGFVYAFLRALHFRPQFMLHPPRRSRGRTLTLRSPVFRDRFEEARQRFAIGTAEAMRLGIIEADAIADSVLKEMGVPGEHMAERLERLSDEEVRSLGSLWRSHRIRNHLVHSPGYEISAEEAKQTLAGYEVFLKEVGVLE